MLMGMGGPCGGGMAALCDGGYIPWPWPWYDEYGWRPMLLMYPEYCCMGCV